MHVNVLSERQKTIRDKKVVSEEMQKQRKRERERNTLQRYLLRWKRRETDKEEKETAGRAKRQR